MSLQSHFPAWLAGLGGIALTTILFANIRQQQARQIQLEFDRRVDNHMRALQNHVASHGEQLFGLRNLFRFSSDVPREKFAEAAQDLIRRHPGIQALKWAPRVAASQRAAFEASGRNAGLTNYQFTEFAEERKLVAAAPRSEHFPLHYIEPLHGNERIMGFDVASDPLRMGWLMQACDTGEPSVSERIMLSKEPHPQASVTVIAPLFRSGADLATRDSRRENLLGFVLGVFRVGDGVKNSLQGIPFGGLEALVVDNSATGTNRFLYFHALGPNPPATPIPTEEDFRTGTHRVEKIALSANREWLVLFRPAPEFLAGLESSQPMFALVSGLSFSALLTAYLLAAGRRSQQVRALVRERTAELETANAKLEKEIHERRHAEQALRESEQRLRTLIEVSPDAILVSRDGRVVFVNETALELFGAMLEGQLLGKTPHDLVHPDFYDVITERRWQVAELGLSAPIIEQKIRRVDGSFADVEVASTPFKDRGGPAILSVFRDVTKRKQAEEESRRLTAKLQEAAKLESLGVMAGGIAHDFNNLLTGILGNASLAKLDLPPDSPAQESLTQVEAASLRAAELCKQMLAYSGKGQFMVQKLDLSAVVRESLDLLHISIGKKATLRLDLAADLPPVDADAVQIGQAIMNLVTNASEAMGDNPGAITVSTGVMRATQTFLSGTVLSPDLAEGEYVFLEVTDTGCGMTADTIGKIFDPFFTTKFAGRGLGLAATLGIVRGHKGALRVTSQPGHGSTFRLLLPVATGKAAGCDEPSPGLSEWQGTGAVLVVDDEEQVRRVAAQSLRRLGFEPVTAGDGRDALRMFEREPNRFVAVLLDLTMPHLDGGQTFQGLRRIRPDVRVILMSGFDQQEAIARFAGKGLAGFLQKPFQLQSLRQRVQAALADQPVAAD